MAAPVSKHDAFENAEGPTEDTARTRKQKRLLPSSWPTVHDVKRVLQHSTGGSGP